MTRLTWFAALAAPVLIAAQGAPVLVTGRVTSGAGTPEAGVTVRIERLDVSTTTGIDGSYRLKLPGGYIPAGATLTITAARDGLKPGSASLRITPAPRLEQDFVLERTTAAD
ncbi:carboxypeptidase-like regulatory domain-containing protein [Sphingomonas canadensis]|uniref:Carboxypeptidase-like regulatory domain-containing protein n=1 Tax=Sphingomonas canadensis TaxID=1219257 RepID=A0ABW3H3T5_9SPHN|nr:carboxypeptidase-like regulatory domain-containing protein [Sphingomonas canadensis]MCW3834563.1 carboxypeptidase-like regulatory domain-containing protein [Sphingomonas canadensis]